MIMYLAYCSSDPMKDLMINNFKQANKEDFSHSIWDINLNPSLAEHYEIDRWSTVLFLDDEVVFGKEIYRLDGPCSIDQINEACNKAKELQLQLLGGVVQ